ncbi:unnamed protein product, partial [Cladocopium goreaui]
TDYLKLECGDMVEVLQHDIKTGWAHGKKVKSARGEPVEGEGHEGWFPDWAVDPASDKSWVELAAEEFSNLDQELRNLRRLDVLADPGDACDFYVDVFASKPGMIKWNPKLQLGRCLLQQHLFSITPEDEDQDEDVYFFNPADTLFDDPLRKDEPFDNRFCPTFSCKTVSRTQNGTTTKVRSTDKPKLVWWNKQQEDFYQAERAQETEKVMERIESEGTSTASGMSPQGHLDVEPETIPLKELCYRAALKGMRLVSKQHVPEICLPAPRQNFGPEMEEIHNQTFMVPLGHEITRDPTTWRLARLKMGRIETAKKKKKDPIEVRSVDGSTYTFSLYSSTMIKICKDSDFQRAIPVHRSLRVTEEGGKRFVEVSADREPIQVAPDQFKQLNKALDLFRIGAAEAQNAYLEAEEKPPPNDNETPAYLNIRYRRYGTVVWVAPMEVFEWQDSRAVTAPSMVRKSCKSKAWLVEASKLGQQSPVNPDRLCGTSMCNLHKRRGEKTGQLEVVDFITVGAKHALELALLRKELEICRSEAAAQIQALREELRSMGLVKLEEPEETIEMAAEVRGAVQAEHQQWHFMPSVGTWIQRPIQLQIQEPEEAIEMAAEVRGAVQAEHQQWHFKPSVGTWIQRPIQLQIQEPEEAIEMAAEVRGNEHQPWHFKPSVGTWIQRPIQLQIQEPALAREMAAEEERWHDDGWIPYSTMLRETVARGSRSPA